MLAYGVYACVKNKEMKYSFINMFACNTIIQKEEEQGNNLYRICSLIQD